LCRVIADLAQQRGYHAILSPSAALAGAVNLKPLSQRPRRPLLAGRRSRKGEGHCGDAPAVLLSAPEPTLSSPSSHRWPGRSLNEITAVLARLAPNAYAW